MVIGAECLGHGMDEVGLAGRPVMVHASLRSFGEPLKSGADGLLDALLSRGCTVLVPSFTEPQFRVTPPPAMRPPRNGIDYAELDGAVPAATRPYAPDCGLIEATLGALPARLIVRPGAVRGRHPLNSFAALGPRAGELIAPQSPADVYAPLRALSQLDGAILLIGVGLNRMTALHLAEQRAGRRLFVRWSSRADGRPVMVETGSCSEGFPRLAPRLRTLARTTAVGASRWTAYPATPTIEAAAAAMATEPEITRCADPDCPACPDAIAGGPLGSYALG